MSTTESSVGEEPVCVFVQWDDALPVGRRQVFPVNPRWVTDHKVDVPHKMRGKGIFL